MTASFAPIMEKLCEECRYYWTECWDNKYLKPDNTCEYFEEEGKW